MPRLSVSRLAGLLTAFVILLGAIENEAPLIFNRISINFRFDTEGKRVVLTQAEVSNGEIGVAGTGSVEYAGEPRLKLGFAATPMPALALKRIWPALIVPEVRAWIIERIERGNVQRVDVAVNSPTRNLPRKGPPIPDDGLDVNILATNVTVHPVDGLPSVRDADMKAHVTGRTATVTIGQGVADTPAGRKLNFSDVVFEVPDMAPKPSPSKVFSRPSTTTRPADGFSSPLISRTRLDFPAPERPITPVIDPRGMAKSIPASACTLGLSR